MQTVLVVEDDAATAAFLADNLEADGFSVATAAEPEEAVRAVELRAPALVILDVVLDGGSGLVVLDRVRRADGASSRIDPEVPVLVLSGRAGEVDRLRGFARGADDYLVKPFSYAELLGAVFKSRFQVAKPHEYWPSDVTNSPASRFELSWGSCLLL